ncbi:MAG: GNAT family N-acetyltransferase [Anaerolineae bacterium]|nr:GNAT family N-acetyltransferase [Anaerolineae bacterium]
MKTHSDQNSEAGTLPRDLGDGLLLRHAEPTDTDALADFNAQIHSERDASEPEMGIWAWTRDLMSGTHPTFRPGDFTLVEDTHAGSIVSSLNLISQTWAYEGIPFKVGRVELVGTHPDYRRRGLIRAQFEAVHRWSTERGEMVQVITGIPWYYRQFGYEMAMTKGGGRLGYRPHVPQLKKGESEPYRVRPATEVDLPFIAELYDRAAERQPVHCLRDEALWRYELRGHSEGSFGRRLLRVVETVSGEPAGFLAHSDGLGDKGIWLSIYELKPGFSWLAVTPSVIRYLWATGEAYAARDQKACETFGFGLGVEHPVYAVFADRLPHINDPYAWYVRVADVAGFLRHVAPALERRLAESAAAGYTGEIEVGFYRSGLLLRFGQGRLAEVVDWSPDAEDSGDAVFPDLTFLHLLFGHRAFDELRRFFPDCGINIHSLARGDEVRAVLEALFPKRPSHVWGIR